jgi:hypothetical protein
VGQPVADFPLDELVRLLGFDGEHDATDFCRHYGVSIDPGRHARISDFAGMHCCPVVLLAGR